MGSADKRPKSSFLGHPHPGRRQGRGGSTLFSCANPFRAGLLARGLRCCNTSQRPRKSSWRLPNALRGQKRCRWKSAARVPTLMLLKPFELRKHKIKEVACISSILSDHHPLGQLCGIAQIGFPERRPEHFVLPACENGQGDPSRGIANWRTALRRITGSIQCPACGEAQNPGKKCRNVECGAKYLIRIHWKDFVSMISGTPRPQGFWNRRRLLQL